MTKKHAKDLSLVLWGYLKDNFEEHQFAYTTDTVKRLAIIQLKKEYPDIIELYYMSHYCSLCDYLDGLCKKCPLGSCGSISDFDIWCHTKSRKRKLYYANEIYNKIQAWEVDND